MFSIKAVTFVSSKSGDFGLNETWVGGLAPTFDRCSPNQGGCHLVVPPNINVTRENNQSTINAVNIYVHGLFEIASWANYWFLYPINFFVHERGIFKDSNRDGFNFYINTSINVETGGLFITKGPTRIYSYRERNQTISEVVIHQQEIAGPYRLLIDQYGQISQHYTFSNSSIVNHQHKLLFYTAYLLVFFYSFYKKN